jgi:hypothetical protein
MTYHIHIFVGYEEIYSAINNSGVESLEMYSAVVGEVFVSISVTDKAGAYSGESANANLSAIGWAEATGYANVTSGTVDVNGTTTTAPAYALLNAASNEAANYTLSFSASISGMASQSFSASGYATLGLAANAAVSFSPALGIVPIHPATNENWTSSSSYTASGNYAGRSHYMVSFPDAYASAANETCSPKNISGTNCILTGNANAASGVSSSGILNLFGADLGTTTVMLPNGQTVNVDIISLFTTGPYGFSGGFILVPITSGLGSLSHTSPLVAPAASSTGTEKLVYNPTDPSHAGVYGQSYGSAGDKTIMSQPQTVNTAETDAQNNIGILSPSSSSSNSGMLVLVILIAVVVAVVVIVAVVIVVSRRRRRPAVAQPQPQPMYQPQPQYQAAPPPPAYQQPPSQAPPPAQYTMPPPPPQA